MCVVCITVGPDYPSSQFLCSDQPVSCSVSRGRSVCFIGGPSDFIRTIYTQVYRDEDKSDGSQAEPRAFPHKGNRSILHFIRLAAYHIQIMMKRDVLVTVNCAFILFCLLDYEMVSLLEVYLYVKTCFVLTLN